VLFLVPGFPLIAGLFDLLQYQTVAAVGRFTFGLMILLSVALGLSFVVEVAKIDISRQPPLELVCQAFMHSKQLCCSIVDRWLRPFRHRLLAGLSLAPWRWVWRRHGFSDRNERVRQVCEKSPGARRRSRLALDRQARAPAATRRHRNRAGSGFSLYFPLMTSLIISVVLS
jgi:hypothetical protein